MGANGSILKLANTGNPTAGSVLQILNTDTDMNSIFAPNFTVTQSGGIKSSVNTSGAILVANGTTFNPVVMSGGCTVDSTGNMTCSGGSATTSLDLNHITSPTGNAGLNFATFNNTWTSTTGNNFWTSTTGTNTWTSGVTAGDMFTIGDSGNFGVTANVLKLVQTGNPTGGNMLYIQNTDAQVTALNITNGGVSVNGSTGFTNLWTNAITSGDYFTIAGSGNFNNTTSMLKIGVTGNPTGGNAIGIIDTDSDTNIIQHPNFSVTQPGVINAKAAILSGSGTPTLSSCGTSPTVTGSNSSFTITVGSVASGCTVTFTSPVWGTNVPHCNVTNQSMSVVNAMTYTETATTLTISQTTLGGALLDVNCH
jgi:hypothetical protein